MMPWLIFLFIGAMDWGFYAYALIATESAARIACLYTSQSGSATDSTTACTYALGQLKRMPNVSSCTAGSTTVSSSAPLALNATSLSSGADGNAAAQVTVTYMTPAYMPMMGLLPKQLTIARTVQMRVN